MADLNNLTPTIDLSNVNEQMDFEPEATPLDIALYQFESIAYDYQFTDKQHELVTNLLKQHIK